MTLWQAHLTPNERAQLVMLKADRLSMAREQRRIYDRARKRAKRAP